MGVGRWDSSYNINIKEALQPALGTTLKQR